MNTNLLTVFNVFYVSDQILLYVELIRIKYFILVKQLIFNVNQKSIRKRTEAYEVMLNNRCPLADHLSAVQTLLNHLENAQVLASKLRKKISSKTE